VYRIIILWVLMEVGVAHLQTHLIPKLVQVPEVGVELIVGTLSAEVQRHRKPHYLYLCWPAAARWVGLDLGTPSSNLTGER
jgi:hypothetical protein